MMEFTLRCDLVKNQVEESMAKWDGKLEDSQALTARAFKNHNNNILISLASFYTQRWILIEWRGLNLECSRHGSKKSGSSIRTINTLIIFDMKLEVGNDLAKRTATNEKLVQCTEEAGNMTETTNRSFITLSRRRFRIKKEISKVLIRRIT